jgi:hypothetical protein
METKYTTSGIGFWGLLTIVFITLKLTHVITWSWVWVLSPLWIGGLLTLFIFSVVFIFGLLLMYLQIKK